MNKELNNLISFINLTIHKNKKSYVIPLLLFSTLILNGQVDSNYVPGKIIRISGKVIKDQGEINSVIEIFSGGTKIEGDLNLSTSGKFTFSFCSNMLTDSTIVINVLEESPKYYYGSLAARLDENKVYEIIIVRDPNKDKYRIPVCGFDEYQEDIKYHESELKRNGLYRHCDGTVKTFKELSIKEKSSKEWIRLK